MWYSFDMIARLRGEVIEHDGGSVVIDCAGVGYYVVVCVDDQAKLPVGQSQVLFISENIKEDAHDLYGFLARTHKMLFDMLTSVNGVGPKAGMAILNVGSEGQVRTAIASGDTKFISAAKGVGKKVAERIVVDLKSKVGLEASADATDFLAEPSLHDEAVEALVALGHNPQDAALLLKGIDSSLPVQERVTLALRGRI